MSLKHFLGVPLSSLDLFELLGVHGRSSEILKELMKSLDILSVPINLSEKLLATLGIMHVESCYI